MGQKILSTDIAGILNKVLGNGRMAKAGTLRSVARTTRDVAALGAGQRPTYTSHAFFGFADTTERYTIPADIQEKTSRVILALGDSIAGGAVPKPNDKVIFEGATSHVLWVDRDPDAATYVMAVRD